jgi:3-phosphoshikimate 1-carboxyvinyltransferase
VIEPAPLHGGEFETYEDHRMATSGALLGLAVPGVRVRDVATTAKTLPDFAGRWTAMLEGRAYQEPEAAPGAGARPSGTAAR